MATILVTGGAGYIGSHTVIKLLEEDYQVIVVDDFSNSHPQALERIKKITNKDFIFYQLDIKNKLELETVFNKHKIDGVIHFAAFKAVGESVCKPLDYYQNNVVGSLVLFELMLKYKVFRIVFSSSATVYGEPKTVPIKEDFPLSATNPYGWSKLMMEQILRDLYTANKELSIAILRYFNPVGAHSSGLIGEDPNGIPNNLMPYISQVAVGIRPYLNIFGNDYNTIDGTGVRDYIHVSDLANGHGLALNYLFNNVGLITLNLGTGQGYSVLEVVHAFEKASFKKIPYEIVRRRPGDIAICYADPSLALQTIGFKTQYNLDSMCRDAWCWQSLNPHGLAT